MIITFVEPTSGEVLYAVQDLPGVMQCEAFRSVPARMCFGHRSQRLAILGIPTGMQLFQLIDDKRGVIQLPEEGVVVSEKLAELLGIREGDLIRVEVLESERPVREVAVSGLIADYAGRSCWRPP